MHTFEDLLRDRLAKCDAFGRFELSPLSTGSKRKRVYRLRSEDGDFIVTGVPAGSRGSDEYFSDFLTSISPSSRIFEEASDHVQQRVGRPALRVQHSGDGVFVHEDLGELTLETFFKKSPDLFGEILHNIFTYNTLLGNGFSSSRILSRRRLGKNEVESELREFLDFGFAGNLDKTPGGASEVLTLLGEFVNEIESLPVQPIHRDLQSRNGIIADDKVFFIDFQDLCVGPRLYDVASLLFDPYLEVGFECREAHAQALWRLGEKENVFGRWEVFWREVGVLAIHRLLKIIGRFNKLNALGITDAYLKYIPRCESLLFSLLNRIRSYEGLTALFARCQ